MIHVMQDAHGSYILAGDYQIAGYEEHGYQIVFSSQWIDDCRSFIATH